MPPASRKKYRPIVLVIADGWGVAPPSPANAITLAKTPTFNRMIANYPAMTLRAAGEAVGLQWGEVGNSEVGHMAIGSGKIIYQNFMQISKAIAEKTFADNEVLLGACAHVKKNKSQLHIIALASDSTVHGSLDHLFATLDLARAQRVKKVFIHIILDGRDVPYNSGRGYVEKIMAKIAKSKSGVIASISGRFYAMDRDSHWERTVMAYRAMVQGVSEYHYTEPLAAIDYSYQHDIYDEEFIPTTLTDDQNKPLATINDDDAIIITNFRSDRARQITRALVDDQLTALPRQSRQNLYIATMIDYGLALPIAVAFSPITVKMPLAKTISKAGLRQLHIAETEKYAHVTYFFNGGVEAPFPGEDRILIPSPRLTSYDQKPTMASSEVTKKVLAAINDDLYDFIVVNYANPDMVGHTGNLKATIKAVEAIDTALKQLIPATLAKNGVLLFTADHGNAEIVLNLQTNVIDKEHSTTPVPLILVGKDWEGKSAGLANTISQDLSLVRPGGLLADIAPTILKLMDISKPTEMEGSSLI